MTGRTSAFGHYYDLAAGGAVLIALFFGIGIGLSAGSWPLGLGVSRRARDRGDLRCCAWSSSAAPARPRPASPTCSAASSRT